MQDIRLGVLASGGGSTFEHVQNAIDAGELPNTEIGLVVCNWSEKNDPGVWERARRLHIPIIHVSNVTEEARTGQCTVPKVPYEDGNIMVPVRGTISREVSDRLVSLADDRGLHMYVGLGYLKLIIGSVLEQIDIANLHPTPLPATAGKYGEEAHKEIMRQRLPYAGATFHWMDKIVGKDGLPPYDIASQADVDRLRIGRDRFRVTRKMRREWRNHGTVTRLQEKGMAREKHFLVTEWIPRAEEQIRSAI